MAFVFSHAIDTFSGMPIFGAPMLSSYRRHVDKINMPLVHVIQLASRAKSVGCARSPRHATSKLALVAHGADASVAIGERWPTFNACQQFSPQMTRGHAGTLASVPSH